MTDRFNHRTLSWLPALLVLVLVRLGAEEPADGGDSRHTLRHRDEVERFAAANPALAQAPAGVVFAGSSNIRLWGGLAERFAPIPVVNRGYGGSRSWELLHDLDTVVVALHPRVVVYSIGTNDLATEPDPRALAGRVRELLDRTHDALPASRILYLSVVRTPARQKLWPAMDEANRLIAVACARRTWAEFIDVNPLFTDAEGAPDLDLYVQDRQHLKSSAYERLAAWIQPRLNAAWAATATP